MHNYSLQTTADLDISVILYIIYKNEDFFL